MKIRRATAVDAPEIVRLKVLVYEAWPFEVEVAADPGWPQRCADTLVELMQRDNFAVFVVDDPDQPGRLVACVTGSVDQRLPMPGSGGRSLYLADMGVEPHLRGRGIGADLMKAVTEWGQSLGAGWASLYATEAGAPLYQRHGFRHAGPFLTMGASLPLGSGQRRASSAACGSTVDETPMTYAGDRAAAHP